MPDRNEAQIFAAASPMLLGLAYRILGSRADAEDAVQDTFLKWQRADKEAIDNAAAWLTTICTRHCIDLLRAAHRTRVDYVGAWLPEPIHTATDESPEDKLSLASSLSTAFLLLLERLTARERAAYLLHEIFDVDYPQIAQTLGVQETTVRKLVSRARANVEQAKIRYVTPVDRQEKLLAASEAAIADGGTDQLAALLADDVQLSADSGGKVPAILQVLQGKAEVLDFVRQVLHRYWASYRWSVSDINGSRGVIIRRGDEIVASMSVGYDERGRATNIYIMRNPDKLARLEGTAIT